jgi:hypothetical protein
MHHDTTSQSYTLRYDCPARGSVSYAGHIFSLTQSARRKLLDMDNRLVDPLNSRLELPQPLTGGFSGDHAANSLWLGSAVRSESEEVLSVRMIGAERRAVGIQGCIRADTRMDSRHLASHTNYLRTPAIYLLLTCQ